MDFIFTFRFFKLVFACAFIFILLDLLWLALVAKKVYLGHMGYLAEVKNSKIVFNLPVGLLAQFIISLGLSVIISIGIKLSPSLGSSLALGAFSGFVLYCTYDLTNLSFVKNYSYFITMVDIGWGTMQGFMAGFYVYWLSIFFKV